MIWLRRTGLLPATGLVDGFVIFLRATPFQGPSRNQDDADRSPDQIGCHQQDLKIACIHKSESNGIYFAVNLSSATLSASTFTPGSPRKPRLAGSVFSLMSSRTLSSLKLRALATRGNCSSALRRLMWGSSPLAEAVTASAGIGV